ncbi:ArsR family transcriptional regulator [Chitinimonas sp. BJB300]|uniref:ArsR family transcriptional regulator n=1 Tax=Chitinimonas sp. BJB300 TaxID=1559339 RepID=UPI000C0C877A|nr:ArsR family transcriptional regulator [Chitinimonas sp. BJB300]PHV12158.1 hypothetical protein CSQ89_07250 [Chitinimonas sp. BJB300]TSJ90110.1 ArsR family transcriptional regulator [Chitinimonas sp. BJB300]
MENLLMAIVALLVERDGMSDSQIAKKLGIGMSQLNRALAVLCSNAELGGLDFVATRQEGKRRTLWLTAKGHELCRS